MTWFPSLTITIYLARNYLAWVSSTVIILLCFVSLIDFVELFQRVARYGLDVSNFKIFLLGLLNLPTLLMRFSHSDYYLVLQFASISGQNLNKLLQLEVLVKISGKPYYP